MTWIPRSGLDAFGELVWLPRMIEKARRQEESRRQRLDLMNGYLFGDNDYIDAQVLRFLRIGDEVVTELVREDPDDAGVAASIIERSGRTVEERRAFSSSLKRKMRNFALMEADEGRMAPGLKRTLLRFVYNRLMMPIIYAMFRRAERKRGTTLATFLALFASLTLLSNAALAAPAVVLATTTSTQDTGLLDVLIPAFEKASGESVKTIAIGTGAALAMGERGDADVLLVHAPSAEEAYMAKGRGLSRALVMHNAFIVAGPAADPAHVKGLPTAEAAFAAIARAKAPFVSRGDDSGTNIKELALWKAAGVTPDPASYVKAGSGMAGTLHVASQKAAYTLTDDGTYLAQRATLAGLVPLVEDAKDLRNVYHVIVVKPIAGRVANEAGAEAFARFVTSPEGQRIIAAYGREKFGRPLFTPDAGKAP